MKYLLFASSIALSILIIDPPTTLALVTRNLRTEQEDASPSNVDTKFEQPKVHPFKRKTTGENKLEFHPMYRMEPAEDDDEEEQEDDNSERNLQSQSQCKSQNIAVKPSEYDVDYETYSDIQYGATPIYWPNNMNVQIGTWYWEWIDDNYGTMMVYWNKKESIFFGFHSSQEFYPISGGYLTSNACPGGYVAFQKWNGDDIRQYRLNVCSGCTESGTRRAVPAEAQGATKGVFATNKADP